MYKTFPNPLNTVHNGNTPHQFFLSYMLVLKMCSDTACAPLSVSIAYRKSIVSDFSVIANNLGSFAEIVKDVDLLF